MTENLGYIDNYFKKFLSAEENNRFEQRIIEDPVFAEEVAFYYASMQAALVQDAEDRNRRFRQIYEEVRTEGRTGAMHIRRILPYLVAAATLLFIITGWYLFVRPETSQQLADNYINASLRSLPVTMSGKEDSTQTGLYYYNQGNFTVALHQFENILRTNTSDFEVIEYAGIVSLRLQDYDKALSYFRKLENNTQLFYNPGKFFHALTLLKRNRSGDTAKAKELLQQVVQYNLTNKEAAKEFLKKL